MNHTLTTKASLSLFGSNTLLLSTIPFLGLETLRYSKEAPSTTKTTTGNTVTTHDLRVTGSDRTTSSTISETSPTSRRRTRDQGEDITATTSGGNVQYDCLSGTAVQSIRAKSGVTR